jgi:hypothetical protein
MSQILLTRNTAQQLSKLFKVNTPEVDFLFPGFAQGDFAIVNTAPTNTYLTSLLCVRAQLPQQLNGLNSDVVFIDGGNTFNAAQVTRIAKLLHLDIKQVMKRIHLHHVATAYEATSTVLDALKNAVEKYSAKFVIVSDIARLFLDENVSDEEAKRVFSQICAYLQSFARQNQITVIATYNPRPKNSRNTELQTVSYEKANVVIKLTQTAYDHEFALEKHPRFMLGCAEFPAENLTLQDFF